MRLRDWLGLRLLGAGILVAGLVSAGLSAPAAADRRVPAASAVSASGVGISAARLAYDRMTPAQRIGQLFMVGGPATGVGSATETAISQYHVGNVILTGRSSSGVAATRSITSGLQNRATSRPRSPCRCSSPPIKRAARCRCCPARASTRYRRR